MPAYSFEALDAQGQTRRGVLEADTARTARSQLRAQHVRKEILVRLPRPLAAQIARNVPASNTAGTLWERQCARKENKEKTKFSL